MNSIEHRTKVIKNFSLFLWILVFTYAINLPVLIFGAMHFEQPVIYLANQQIASFYDLLHIYLHPKQLYVYTPFFRPNGHFLVYQLISYFFGWHHFRLLIAINLFFLSMSGFLMVKIYQLLFSKFKIGGYIAFALYAMHPCLVVSRFFGMHFGYSYITFSLLSLYLFMVFYEKNLTLSHRYSSPEHDHEKMKHLNLNAPFELKSKPSFRTFRFRYSYLFWLSMLSYSIAVTFKETTIVTSGILLSYALIRLSMESCSPWDLIKNKLICRDNLKYFAIVITVAFLLGLYISSAFVETAGTNNLTTLYQVLSSPIRFQTLKSFLSLMFAFWRSNDMWTGYGIQYNFLSLLFIYGFSLLSLVSTAWIIFRYKFFKKILLQLIFLWLAFLCALSLPVMRGGWPWHISLAIVFLSLFMGFSFDFITQQLINRRKAEILGWTLFILIGFTAVTVAIRYTHSNPLNTAFLLKAARNAVLHPPPLEKKLGPTSILIVADHLPISNYFLGASFYPIDNPDQLNEYSKGFFIKPTSTYNGTLFRFAYLMPHLKEENYIFDVTRLDKVPDKIIYDWLNNYNDLFCVTYNDHAEWYDVTQIFKKNLLREKIHRKKMQKIEG